MTWRNFHEKLKEVLRNIRRFNLDEIAELIAGLGIPALVLIVLIAVSGYYGAAAIAVALATMGGPLGMVGGAIAMAALALIARAGAKYGIERLFRAVFIKIMKKENKTKDEIEEVIDGYFVFYDKLKISEELKRKIKEYIRQSCDCCD